MKVEDYGEAELKRLGKEGDEPVAKPFEGGAGTKYRKINEETHLDIAVLMGHLGSLKLKKIEMTNG